MDRPVAALVLSVTAGAFILAGATAMLWWATWGFASMPGMSEMMGPERDMMEAMMGGMMGMGLMMPIFGGFGFLGLASGMVVIVGGFMLYSKPNDSVLWGAMILAFSVISLLGMGGFLVGAILGIVGGALGLSWKGKAPNRSRGA